MLSLQDQKRISQLEKFLDPNSGATDAERENAKALIDRIRAKDGGSSIFKDGSAVAYNIFTDQMTRAEAYMFGFAEALHKMGDIGESLSEFLKSVEGGGWNGKREE